MGNSQSSQKINYEDVQYVIKNSELHILINTLNEASSINDTFNKLLLNSATNELNEDADPKKTSKVREIVKLIAMAPEEDKAALEGIAKNYYNFPWYWEMSDARNTEQKAERKNAILKKLVNSLQSEEAEDVAMDIHNIYAPDDRRITSVNQIG